MLIKGLYTVVLNEKTEEGLKVTVKLHKEHEVFKGHFPDEPLLPGVCMIQMTKELVEAELEKELFLSVASNVKFMAKINPEVNEIIDLSLTLKEEDDFIKVKNVTSYDETVALKLNVTFKRMD